VASPDSSETDTELALGEQINNPPVDLTDNHSPVWPDESGVFAVKTGENIKLVWTSALDNNGAVGYKIFSRRLDTWEEKTTEVGMVNNYTFSGFAANDYYFRVDAYDGKPNIKNGPEIQYNISADEKIAPVWDESVLAVTDQSVANRIRLGWGSVVPAEEEGDLSYFELEYQLGSGNWSKIIISKGDGTANKELFLSAGTYNFRVNAIDMFGNISSGPVKNGVVVSGAVGIDVEPPKFSGSVAEVSLIKKAQGSYEFSWPGATDNIKVREYEYKVDVLFGANVIPWTKTTNLKTTVSGLSNGNYVVHIKANDTSGNVQINDKNGNQMMRQLTVN
jgi:hypothetical protein